MTQEYVGLVSQVVRHYRAVRLPLPRAHAGRKLRQELKRFLQMLPGLCLVPIDTADSHMDLAQYKEPLRVTAAKPFYLRGSGQRLLIAPKSILEFPEIRFGGIGTRL